MVVYSCKKCGEPNFLTPHAFWNISDFSAKCEKCETTNSITLKNVEPKKKIRMNTSIYVYFVKTILITNRKGIVAMMKIRMITLCMKAIK
jgi:hypothetical protein